ncbi:hypothetical protein QA646_17810 [Rhizobium sp. CB3090]|uniref:hypothetical protein n=1 Tax=Rhizobium sp. CB3090 TaxID=3039156 RepID=UPI0024B0C8A6|nr:hypothetical protein [Rhizobium sp. CB3090]WFU09102.1 hypothetical protein QA646_17810 [Rhizobium sp. CB3090]
MGIVARLARSTGSNDPLREELRKAIETHAQAKQERDRLAAALENALQRCYGASDDLDNLAVRVSDLVDTRSQRAAARALAGADPIDNELKEAQRRLSEAEEFLEAARAATAVLEGSLGVAEDILKSSERRLRDAAGNVLLTKASEVENRIRSLIVEISPLFATLSYLQSRDNANVYPTDDYRQRKRLLECPLEAMPVYGKSLNHTEVAPIIDPWKQAFEALLSDANAPLPEV